jgi:Holliday junction resolvase-like predicted endonuclease
MNKAKKGKTRENIAKHELEAEGYWVGFKSYTMRLGPIFKGIDLFGLFDLLAIRGDHWRFISVKHRKSGDVSENRKAILNFIEQHALHNMSFELWIWHEPRTVGRGKNKKFVKAHWIKEVLG